MTWFPGVLSARHIPQETVYFLVTTAIFGNTARHRSELQGFLQLFTYGHFFSCLSCLKPEQMLLIPLTFIALIKKTQTLTKQTMLKQHFTLWLFCSIWEMLHPNDIPVPCDIWFLQGKKVESTDNTFSLSSCYRHYLVLRTIFVQVFINVTMNFNP